MITYCTNIHPGEGWDEHFAQLREHLPAVRRAVSPDRPFPVGLRLSRQAAMELNDGETERFREWCVEEGCFVPTINGFPYGAFHSPPVKERVYLPDWRSPERAAFTIRLADLLSRWLPVGVNGSLSTVPIGFRGHVSLDDLPLIRRNLLEVALHLSWLRERRGQEIILCLEPEPGCLMETTADVVRFFELLRLPKAVRDLVGICFDCCHQAVEFENPADDLTILSTAGIRIGKVHVSSALRLPRFDRDALAAFLEPCYLHQVAVRREDGSIARYNDLPEALACAGERELAGEWRIHFHLPVFLDHAGPCATTRPFLEEFLPLVGRDTLLEVETYTWQVLPPELQAEGLDGSIVREIHWVEGLLS